MIGDVSVPAGAYTLWSTYSAEGGTLIINSQTGQWGTAHDPEQDFARIPMDESALSDPVERFTISIDDTDAGGALNLDWDRRRYSVEFTVQ